MISAAELRIDANTAHIFILNKTQQEVGDTNLLVFTGYDKIQQSQVRLAMLG